MAFNVRLLEVETCDKCGVPASLEQPIIQIYQGNREDRNMIFVHERCLTKLIEKAKKAYPTKTA